MVGFCLTVLVGWVSLNAAEAACDVELERIDTASWNRSGGYDVFDAVGYADRFGFEVLHLDKDGEPCEVIASVEPIGGPRLNGPGGEALAYEVRTAANIANGTNGVEFRLDLEPGERRQLGYFIFLPPGQFVAGGGYEGRLAVSVVEDIDGSLEAEDRREIPVRASAGSGAQISFVGAVGRRQTVDFGELTDGKSSPPVFLDIRSTTDYEIRLTSEEGGRLVQRADGRTWAVDYATVLENARIDLGPNTSKNLRFSGPTDPAGRRSPLTFELGVVGDQRAGSYRDRITIEITPTSR